MKKNLRNLGLMALSLIAVALTSCNNNEPMVVMQKNILQTIQTDAQFTTLAKALKVTGLETTLSGTTKFTLFAPTNAAFTALSITTTSLDTQTPAQIADLKNILLNHVVNDTKLSTSLATGYVKTNASFGTTTSKLSCYVKVTGSMVMLNGLAMVTAADKVATNGVVHTIDKVLVLPTLVSHAQANADLSTLVTVVTSGPQGAFGDQSAVLSALNSATSAAPLTVFAPTNAAFTAATTGSGFAVGASAATVTNVLLYHAVGGNVLAGTLTEGQMVPTAFNGQTFEITLMGGAHIIDDSDVEAKIVLTDIQAANGVIHVVDKVLQPML
jgi:uncharacterized surface protein with fasciclin (FAS1) repeats